MAGKVIKLHSDISSADLSTAITLLRRYSNLEVVSKYLRDRSLHSSATSWQEMRDSRLQPALNAGKINRADILALIREAEEFGKQHVFLYKCSRSAAGELLDESTLSQRLRKMNIADLREKPRIIDGSKGLQLVDVRIDSTNAVRSLVMKAVDTRAYKRLIGRETKGSLEILTYDTEYDRGVNVISVRSDGLTEVRIQSHHNTLDYRKHVDDMFAKAVGIIDSLQFPPLSLAKTRLYMINNRRRLAGTVRFYDNLLRDKEGNAMSLASGSRQQNLFEDGSPSDRGLAAFMLGGKSTCDEVDCSWLNLEDNSGPSTDIHTLIEGANNEFIVNARCARADYAYVLEKITSFAQ